MYDAVYLPPVQHGDVYRLASLRRPRAIGIIDGYFQQVPAVWHKEILWAMEQGIDVFGSASMGALRAAELAPFGMQGVGRIFEAYRDRALAPYFSEPFEDDDEVAVIHGPPEAGYVAVSEALVNIRCTLAAAESAKVIGKSTRDALVAGMKRLFYPERSYEKLFDHGTLNNLPETELDALRAWLPDGKLDQKRDDAIALLSTMRDFLSSNPPARNVDYTLEHTTLWDTTKARIDAGDEEDWRVLEELRLEGAAFFSVRRAALLRLLGLAFHGELDHGDNADQSREISDALRRALNIPEFRAVERELVKNHGNAGAVARLLRDESRIKTLKSIAETIPEPLLNRHLLACLQETGEYDRLKERSREKQRMFLSEGRVPSEFDLTGPETLQLADWYFEHRLDRQMPDDMESYVESLGFAGMDTFHRALLHEYVFVSGKEQLRASGA